MNQVTFNFYFKQSYWLAKVIRWATHGRFNHVSVSVNGLTWEAIGGRLNAVVVSHNPETYHQGKYQVTELTKITLDCTDKQLAAVQHYLISTEGQPYDLLGVLAFLWPGIKLSNKKYFCSEIAAKIVEVLTGKTLEDKLVTPTELYDLVTALKN